MTDLQLAIAAVFLGGLAGALAALIAQRRRRRQWRDLADRTPYILKD